MVMKVQVALGQSKMVNKGAPPGQLVLSQKTWLQQPAIQICRSFVQTERIKSILVPEVSRIFDFPA